MCSLLGPTMEKSIKYTHIARNREVVSTGFYNLTSEVL